MSNELQAVMDMLESIKGDEDAMSIVNGILLDSAVNDVWVPLPGPQTEAYYSEADILGYGGAAGGGKLLRLGELIVTPDGFTTMGEVSVGDILFDKNGDKCKVTSLSNVELTPELYEFEFDDGTKITSCIDHQWLTTTTRERDSKKPGNVRTTKQIVDTLLLKGGRKNHAIPLTKPLTLRSQELKIPPYVLGAWLGDGSRANGNFTNIDDQITDTIKLQGYEVSHSLKDLQHHCILGLKVQLREMSLLMNKHIPQIYMRSSREDRLDLLKGLMDTDGTVAKHSGSAEFCNTNEQIIDGVVELIVSLGWKVRKREGRAKLYGKDCGPKWTLKWIPSEYVFNLDRKKKLQTIASRLTTTMRYILSATSVASEPGRCITVDSPSSTYLVSKQMLVTHNTDLACGKALTQHKNVAILRRESTQLGGIYERLTELIGDNNGLNKQSKEWRVPIGTQPHIVFGSTPNPGDENKYQGRPKDLLILDEAANFLELMARFLMGWVRTVDPNQKTQVLLTFNPPTTPEGQWIRNYFAPWLDKKHPDYPTRPGTLLHYITLDGEDYKVSKKMQVQPGELIPGTDIKNNEEYPLISQSRTFIPSRVKDNPYLMQTGYTATLQAMPEPLRSQMLKGDFAAGMEDDPWQVIPTSWIEAAMARWEPRDKKGDMTSQGVDVARGGRDKTVIANRHSNWFDEPIRLQGEATINGPKVAGQVITHRRNAAPIHIDIIGVGSSPYDFLDQSDVHVIGICNSNKSYAHDTATGKLTFLNLRAETWWRMREWLDPINDTGAMLPPDPKLLADLATPLWEFRSGGVIKIEAKEEIIKRLGRSPDDGDAYVLGLIDTPKRQADLLGVNKKFVKDWDKFDPLS